LCLQVELD